MDVSLLLSPKGRINRSEFWLGFLILSVLRALTGGFGIVGQIVTIVLLWPQIAIYVKRLHDMGFTGWLQLLPVVVGAACFVLIAMNGGAEAVQSLSTSPSGMLKFFTSPETRKIAVFFEIALAVQVAFLGWIGFTKGDAEANKFGPAPQQAGN